jgi:thioredoxin 1
MNRRRFNALALAVLAAPFAAADPVLARDFAAYRADSFPKLLGAGGSLIVHVHADWCAVCRAQMPIINKALAAPAYANVKTVRVNFDKDKQFLADYKVVRQATIVAFKGGKEVARLSYDTDEEKIRKTLAAAL